MSLPSINPVARNLFLCDGQIGYPSAKTDLVGLFSRIRPGHYPHNHSYFVVFAQLSSGLGQVPIYVDIRDATDGSLVRSTNVQLLRFPSRDAIVELAYTIRDCSFPRAGFYLVELYCNAQWIADTKLELL